MDMVNLKTFTELTMLKQKYEMKFTSWLELGYFIFKMLLFD